MPTLRINLASALVAVCAVATLGACGNDTGTGDTASESTSESPTETASETTTEPGALPECEDVWVDGQDLPKDYTACLSEGETIKPVKRRCGYGASFFEQDGRFYAMLGRPITDAGDLETSDEYQKLLTTCQA